MLVASDYDFARALVAPTTSMMPNVRAGGLDGESGRGGGGCDGAMVRGGETLWDGGGVATRRARERGGRRLGRRSGGSAVGSRALSR